MGNDSQSDYGPALMAYVDAELAARGITPTAFATQHGMTVAQFGRWRSGETQPRLGAIVELAQALDKPPLELLALTIGAVAPGDPGAPQVTEAPRIADAIELDPTLTDFERGLLQDVWGSLRRFRGGESEVTVTNSRRHRR